MASIQAQFRTFHGTIKLNWNDEQATLREKRGIVIQKLRDQLKKRFEDEKKPVPTFEERNQGSYAMGTGVKPLDSDFDLDVALLFNLSKDDEQPVTVKQWVHDALDGHTKDVKIKRPCVTVQYVKDDEPAYHLDLAVYAAKNDDDKVFLAKGFPGSAAENKVWEESDPMALVAAVDARHAGEDRDQFKRVICYLKRWKDEKFPTNGEAAPRGIALTSAAYHWFQPVSTLVDVVSMKREYDDHKATYDLVMNMLGRFASEWDGATNSLRPRLHAPLPVPPNQDPFDRMSFGQMESFKTKLESLRDALKASMDEVDPHVACQHLADNAFGKDFPVPPKEETASRGGPSIISSNTSA